MRKTITKLEPDSSKQQEIDFLNEIAESIPDDAYLKTLFTEDFVGRVTRWIKDDWTCDMAGTLQGYMDENSDLRVEMDANRKRYASEIRELEEQAEQLSNHLRVAKGTIGEQENVIRESNDRHWKLIQKHGMERREMRDEIVRTEGYVEQREAEIDGLNRKVLELKAKMYDMQNEILNLRQELERDDND